MIALMVPPLPAASRPSNTTITRSPLCTTQSCKRHNSVWSLRSFFSYSLRFIFGEASSACFFDISRLLAGDPVVLLCVHDATAVGALSFAESWVVGGGEPAASRPQARAT